MSKSTMLRLASLSVLFFALLLVLGNSAVTHAAKPLPFKRLALRTVAARTNIPVKQLQVVTRARGNYPLQDIRTRDFKIMDKISGDIFGVSLNEERQEADPAALLAAEEALRAATYGNLEPDLYEQLKAASPDATIPVILWLKMQPYEGTARPEAGSDIADVGAEKMDEFQAATDASLARAVESAVAPIEERMRSLGVEVATDKYTPVLYGKVSPAAISEMKNWQEIEQIYLDRKAEPALDIARKTIGADVANFRGYTGSGVLIAQIEVGGRVVTNNPNLSGLTHDTTYVCSAVSPHSTGVAGIMRSTHSSVRGIAPAATLRVGGSCDGVSSELQNRSTAAADWGARAINLSWGANTNRVPGANDRFYDNMVINRYRSIVVAAGNRAGRCAGDGNILSPALAYNIVTVGNFDDGNTKSWPGDSMNECSSWRDPSSTNSDREEPDVSAPGTNINSTTTASPWTGDIGSGTSYAAPMVTGMIALLIQRNSTLGSWPEAVRAILMTSAVHNIEGATRLSEYDGAGGVHAVMADDIARGYLGGWTGMNYNCTTASPYTVKSVYLTAGKRTRIAIAWDNDPAFSSYASQPGADLDLQIVNPSGSAVTGSYSYDNTYEIVQFTPITTGTYRIRVTRPRCDYSPKYLGVAWKQG